MASLQRRDAFRPYAAGCALRWFRRRAFWGGIFGRCCSFYLLVLIFSGVNTAGGQAAAETEPTYDVQYRGALRSDCQADVAIKIQENKDFLRVVRIRVDSDRYSAFTSPNEIKQSASHLEWHLSPGEAELRYRVRIDHERSAGGYDARCTKDWALFRGEDLFPPASSVAPEELHHANATLILNVPAGWSVITPFPENKDGSFKIEQPHRFFDRPTGWILVGDLAVLRERIRGVSVVIASPKGQQVRHHDQLALLQWALPQLVEILPEFPEELLVVSAADPMWRGGLSGPNSIYIHAERPLISWDGTSPLLHELLHVGIHAKSAKNGDWIVEGLAEYYSLQLLRRSRTIDKRRYRKALEKLAKRGRKAESVLVVYSHGAVTARAVDILHQLDLLIRKETEEEKSLDDVLRSLASERTPITTEHFRALAEQVAGRDLSDFFAEHVH